MSTFNFSKEWVGDCFLADSTVNAFLFELPQLTQAGMVQEHTTPPAVMNFAEWKGLM